MLIITFHNDGTGTPEIGHYDVQVFINRKEIYRGRVENHPRNDFRDLIIQWAAQLKQEKLNSIPRT